MSEEKVEAPLTSEYLKRLPRHARYMPQVPGWIPWIVFFGLNAALEKPIGGGPAFVLAVLIAWSIPLIVRLPFRPRSNEESSEQKFLDSVHRMRSLAHDGRLRKMVPPQVLAALERCAGARTAALARLAGADPVEQAVESEAVEGCMRAAIAAVVPLVRADDQRRREWEALCENHSVIGAVVDAIQALQDRMDRPSSVLTERLIALRELEEAQLPVEPPSAQVATN